MSLSYPERVNRSPASRGASRWLLTSVPVIMILMFVVPYTLLREVNAWYGSFLFWIVGTLVVIAINVILALQWED